MLNKIHIYPNFLSEEDHKALLQFSIDNPQAYGETREDNFWAGRTFEPIQYDAVHHYENGDKEYADIDPLNQDTASLTAITEMDRQLTFNNNLKNISVIKPSAINEVSNEFKRLLRQ